MKKLILLIILMFLYTPAALASPSFDSVLSEQINEYGIFDGKDGIVYADEKNFENRRSLFIVRVTETSFVCEIYDDADGIQLTDSIEFSFKKNSSCRLAAVKKNGADFIMFSSGSNTPDEYFTLQNDTFTKVNPGGYDSVIYIVSGKKGKITAHVKPLEVQRFLNGLKEDTISGYPFSNKVNTIPAQDAETIRTTLTACADVMKFDIKNYDYDSFFKYVLYTHNNFRILTDIDPMTGNSSSLGYNNVSIVSSDFIDWVMENIFRVTPEKPPVNSLTSRGFCYNGGYYCYTGGFDVYFGTKIQELEGVYDLGGGVTFVVFSDIYYENDSETPEYSFAVLQKTGGKYSVLRLGMGENLPSADEVKIYSPLSSYGNMKWDADSANNGKTSGNRLLLPLFLLVIAVGIVGFVCSVVALVKTRK